MKISIIIPTYNEEKYLPKLLESIKKQNYSDYEIIVADAGSKDNTKRIAKKYGCRLVKGGSPSEGRNSGAKYSKGELLLFLDSDVVLFDDYLSKAIFDFEKKKLSIAMTHIVPMSDSEIDKFLYDFANFFMKSVESIKPHGAGCYGVIVKKDLHEKIGGFDELMDFGEDTDYIERASKYGKFKVLSKPKLFMSTRRFDKEGRIKLSLKYTKSTLYQFMGKKISAKELGYDFGYDDSNKRILYAVCGEGMGHAIRTVPIVNHLLEEHDVMIVASGRAYEYLNDKFDNVFNIEGFNIVYENNVVNNRKTAINAIKDLPRDIRKNFKILFGIIKKFKPNIIISDFEFFSNLIAKIMNIPLISLDNQHIMTKTKIDVPSKYFKDMIASVSVVRSFIIRPKKYLITTFFYPPVKNKKRVLLFPPILRSCILKEKPKVGKHIFVYQTSSSYKKMIDILKSFKDERFIVYGHHKEEKDGNIQFRKFNEDKFLKEFSSAKAVITNGGFTLIGEALYLNKPILSIPVKKQFEQFLNALYLKRLGYGEFEKELTKSNLNSFLNNLDFYRENLKEYNREDNSKILSKIDELILKYSKKYK